MTKEKMITFSNETKSLIWSRFVQPANGTEEEARHFIEVCEQFGLNPLLGDIIYQRFETKSGPKSNFITTRDGLLRVATNQPGYVGPPNANVVKEGDHFEFVPAEGTVKHKFGTKRGNILGAYAIMQHKQHNPVAVFVDFNEYYQANSGQINSRYGNPNIWDKLPSAMIIKTAESFVLKRQFPLGGLYTQEEMGLEEAINMPTPPASTANQHGNTQKQVVNNKPQGKKLETQNKSINKAQKQDENQSSQSASNKVNSKDLQQIKGVLKSFKMKKSARGKEYGLLELKDEKSTDPYNILVRDEKGQQIFQNMQPESVIHISIEKDDGFFFFVAFIDNNQSQSESAKEHDTMAQQTSNETVSEQETSNNDTDGYDVVHGKLSAIKSGKKGQIEFVKMAFITDNGEKMNLIAHNEDHVNQALTLVQDEPTSIKVKNENGFDYFVGIENINQKAG